MIILTIRTDSKDAEIGLFSDQERLDYQVWHADRELSLTILPRIKEILEKNNKDWQSINGILVFKGPGSFTGLRIGHAVANSLAYGLKTPIVTNGGSNWLEHGINRLISGDNETIAIPEYGADANITQPKK